MEIKSGETNTKTLKQPSCSFPRDTFFIISVRLTLVLSSVVYSGHIFIAKRHIYLPPRGRQFHFHLLVAITIQYKSSQTLERITLRSIEDYKAEWEVSSIETSFVFNTEGKSPNIGHGQKIIQYIQMMLQQVGAMISTRHARFSCCKCSLASINTHYHQVVVLSDLASAAYHNYKRASLYLNMMGNVKVPMIVQKVHIL